MKLKNLKILKNRCMANVWQHFKNVWQMYGKFDVLKSGFKSGR